MQEKKGFTLVELIVTIALLAVITTIIVVNMVALKNKEDDKEQTRVESTIKTAAEAYIEVEGLEQSSSTCVNVRELVQDNYLKEDYVKDYLNNSVIIVKSGEKTTYEIIEGTNCTAQKQEITITFDAMDGVIKNSPNSLTEVKIEKGDNLKSREIPEAYQKYYAFLGWYEDQKYTKKVDEKTEFNQNTTLYAGYQIKEFNIEYQNEGSNSTTQVLRYKENKNLEANPFSKTGYSFVDWSTSDNEIKNIKDKARVNDAIWDYAWEHDNKIELVANFQANNYIVTFDANGEDISISPSSKLVTYDSTYGELPSPKRTYYDFDGWSLKKDIKDEVTSSTKVTTARDHTLYAMWDLHNYKITLDQNGATSKGSTEVETTYASTNVKVENPQREYTVKVTNNAGATLSGSTNIKAEYKFSGWYDEDSKILDESGKFIANTAYTDASGSWIYDGDTTLKANWVAPSITLPKVIKEGYTCGFATSSNGKIEYKSGSSMTPSKNMNLYTVCEANSYVVTYNANGGSVSPNNKTVKYNSTYGSLPTPTRKGYNFLGWYYNNQKITSNSIVKVATNHTLIAKWEASEYSLQVNTLNGYISNIEVKDKSNKVLIDKSCDETDRKCLPEAVSTEAATISLEVVPDDKYILDNAMAVNASAAVTSNTVIVRNISGNVEVNINNYKNMLLQVESIHGDHDFSNYNNSSWKQANQMHLDIKDEAFDGGAGYEFENILTPENQHSYGYEYSDTNDGYPANVNWILGIVGNNFIYGSNETYDYSQSDANKHYVHLFNNYRQENNTYLNTFQYRFSYHTGNPSNHLTVSPFTDQENEKVYFFVNEDYGSNYANFYGYELSKEDDDPNYLQYCFVEQIGDTPNRNVDCDGISASSNNLWDYLNLDLNEIDNNLIMESKNAQIWSFDRISAPKKYKDALTLEAIKPYYPYRRYSSAGRPDTIENSLLLSSNGFEEGDTYYFKTQDGGYGVLWYFKYYKRETNGINFQLVSVVYKDEKSTNGKNYFLNEPVENRDNYFATFYVLDLNDSYGVSQYWYKNLKSISISSSFDSLILINQNDKVKTYPSSEFKKNSCSRKNDDCKVNNIDHLMDYIVKYYK